MSHHYSAFTNVIAFTNYFKRQDVLSLQDQSDNESVVEVLDQAVPVVPVVPVVIQPQVVYDVEDDADIEITYSDIRPMHEIPADYRERAKICSEQNIIE